MKLILGDSLYKLRDLPSNTVDAVVTDPPYGLIFMGKKWDCQVPSVELWQEVIRILKPGGHLLSFGGTRTYHRMVVAIEDAGFEVRDQMQWIYGSGFPKSLNLKGEHAGWGTALKPANEPIVLARKPLERGLTVAQNVEKWGCGAINVDGCRIGTTGGKPNVVATLDYQDKTDKNGTAKFRTKNVIHDDAVKGRWPANILFDEEAAAMLDEQSGVSKSTKNKVSDNRQNKNNSMFIDGVHNANYSHCDSGGASRFFYIAKTSKRERNAGLDCYERIDIVTSCTKEESTAAAQLLQRVISESTAKWLIGESGANISVIFQKECRSTIKTETNKIIESEILSLLIHSLIKESIPAALEASSHAATVESLKKYLLNITSGKMESALGAANAASKMLHTIKESVGPSEYKSNHPTVKPIKLMEYLCKLITPPGGIILDPFMGSGSTGCAARKLGFQFIGIEQDAEYIEIARRRIEHWSSETEQLELANG